MGGAPFSAQRPPLPTESAATGPDLLMVALEAELLLLQRLLLGLQVSLSQAHVIQDLVQPTQVCLHRHAQGALTVVPSITEGAGQPRCQGEPLSAGPAPTLFTNMDPRLLIGLNTGLGDELDPVPTLKQLTV